MGTFEQGYMGPFRGKLGTAVGSRWKGLYVLRSRPPRKRTGPASESQLEVQAKFLLVVQFLPGGISGNLGDRAAKYLFNRAEPLRKKGVTADHPPRKITSEYH